MLQCRDLKISSGYTNVINQINLIAFKAELILPKHRQLDCLYLRCIAIEVQKSVYLLPGVMHTVGFSLC